MNYIHHPAFTFAMSMSGFFLHFLPSWSEFYRSKDTPRIGLLAYVKLDLPAWIASALGAVVFYFAGSAIIGPMLAESKAEAFVALLAGYVGSSFAPKILGSFAARVSIR